ncbi:MAG TPA: metallophosphoesterase [Caulifigura sp.]|nr:metallophosphoesterase [Caulifigura sp.]
MSARDAASPKGRWWSFVDTWARDAFALIAVGLAVLTLVTPLLAAEPARRIGVFLVMAAFLEAVHGLRRATAAGQQEAWSGAFITLCMGLLLFTSPFLASSALVLFLSGWFALAAVRSLTAAWRGGGPQRSAGGFVLRAAIDLAAAAALLLFRGTFLEWLLAATAAYQILETAWEIRTSVVVTSRDSGSVVLETLGLTDSPELSAIANEMANEELSRSAIDRGWILGFIATLFAIHVGRMGFDRSFLGIVSPVVAVAGDVMVAMLLAFAIVIPVSMTWRRMTRPVERRVWNWYLAGGSQQRSWGRRLVRFGLGYRLRRSIRLQHAQSSARMALSRALQIGLPLSAIIAATTPVWGMSWYFDTENWAAGVWNSWAAERTDVWREAMVRPLWPAEEAKEDSRKLAIDAGSFDHNADFSFLVIGDPGEGDASQHVLRAQLLELVRRDDVKFVIISSDVVYPTGAMRNYETGFWLPFMGTTKPVFAIPGNHDWYDALDAFAATFYEPDAARVAIRGRVEADAGVSSTTEARIEELISIAGRLQSEYEVPVQRQRASYFQFQTPTFALFTVDTGVERTLDPLQWEWLEKALVSAAGKTKMAILGHPFYAGGHYIPEADTEFLRLHELLKKHDVAIVMAGDTHDLEFYEESPGPSGRPTLHFVNGGGGAYLSFGTALAWPKDPPTEKWDYYPGRQQVHDKIELTTPAWKLPAWWWTKYFGAWPFSAEGLSAAFDVNTAPFMQSLVEVRIEPSQNRIRLIPYGIHGQLRWKDFDRSASGSDPEELAEWTVPLARRP